MLEWSTSFNKPNRNLCGKNCFQAAEAINPENAE